VGQRVRDRDWYNSASTVSRYALLSLHTRCARSIPPHTQRFVALDDTSPHNWLDDNFWLPKAYLERRASLLIHSNWWVIFRDDLGIPELATRGVSETVAGISPWQIRRSASLTYHLLVYKNTLSKYVYLLHSPGRGGLPKVLIVSSGAGIFLNSQRHKSGSAIQAARCGTLLGCPVQTVTFLRQNHIRRHQTRGQ
jgi:hypothetical protein